MENLVNSRPFSAPPAGAQSALQQEAGQSSAVPAPLETAEQLLPRQVLTYVAAKCLAINPTLGQATSEESTELGD